MKRIYHFLLMGLLSSAAANAQQSQTSPSMTLDQCISYALENAVNIKNAVIDERIADARVRETRGIGLPQVEANVAVQHNQKLRRFFMQYSSDSPFLPSGIAGLEEGDVVAAQNFFQLKSSGDAGLTINQLIFNGSYLVGLQAANAYRDLAVRTSAQTREETVQQVTRAYYGVLINKDRIGLFTANITRLENLLKTTRALNENGFAESIDVDRIQVALNNVLAERDKFKNLQELTVQLLKFQMNYPMNQQLDVTGDIASLQIDENVLSRYSLDFDHSQRSDYQVLEATRRLQSLDVKNKFAAALPSLGAFANLGYSSQSPDVAGLLRTETTFDSNDQLGPDEWYGYSLFGVNLNIPLFSGLQRTYSLQQSKLRMMKIENSFSTLKSAIDLEVKQAAINYLNAVTSLKSQDANRKLAENVSRVSAIKYQEGVGSNLEVIDAESSLREAQINYYNALYDALVAKVDLDKSYGKLIPQNENEQK